MSYTSADVLQFYRVGSEFRPVLRLGAKPGAVDKKSAKAEKKAKKQQRVAAAAAATGAAPKPGPGGEKKQKKAVEMQPELPKVKKERKIPLPEPGRRNILITSALPYVNNVPHLGNIIGCVLSADVYNRFCRLRGYNSIYICGTDEYGTATETKAIQEGLTPQQICDKYHAIHREIYELFDIDFDHFGRTTTPQQTEIAQGIFKDLQKNGLLKPDEIEQLHCDKCPRFLADRLVEGTCPLCGYDDARGDQCDACGKLLNPIELLKPRCKVCSATPSPRTTKHLFLDLEKLQPELTDFVARSSVKGGWSANSLSVTNAWIRAGLQPRCITRDLKWGTPVPDPEYANKVFYVWFDAPIGYISITACATPEWRQWWQNPENVDLVQFMGKDNIPFHTVIFPSSLIGSRQPWSLLHHISTTEYLNYESGKFSKSRGVGVFGDNVRDIGIPIEVWRYYLLVNRPEVSDTVFTWTDFAQKNNSELLNNLGNFCNRALTFLVNNFDAIIPPRFPEPVPEAEAKVITDVTALVREYIATLDAVKIKDGLRIAMAVSKIGNEYMQHNAPWELVKTDRTRCSHVLNLVCNLAFLLATLLEPYIPSFSAKLLHQMALPLSPLPPGDAFSLDLIPVGHRIGKPLPIFRKISDAEVKQLRERYAPPDEIKFPLDLRLGRILSCEPVPESEKLHKLSVDVTLPGADSKKDVRQVIAGLQAHYPVDALVGKIVVVLCNLKKAKLAGLESFGMVIASAKSKDLGVLTVSPKVAATDSLVGQRVVPSDTVLELPPGLLGKKDFEKVQLNSLPDGTVAFKKNFVLTAEHAGPILADKGIIGGKIA